MNRLVSFFLVCVAFVGVVFGEDFDVGFFSFVPTSTPTHSPTPMPTPHDKYKCGERCTTPVGTIVDVLSLCTAICPGSFQVFDSTNTFAEVEAVTTSSSSGDRCIEIADHLQVASSDSVLDVSGISKCIKMTLTVSTVMPLAFNVLSTGSGTVLAYLTGNYRGSLDATATSGASGVNLYVGPLATIAANDLFGGAGADKVEFRGLFVGSTLSLRGGVDQIYITGAAANLSASILGDAGDDTVFINAGARVFALNVTNVGNDQVVIVDSTIGNIFLDNFEQKETTNRTELLVSSSTAGHIFLRGGIRCLQIHNSIVANITTGTGQRVKQDRYEIVSSQIGDAMLLSGVFNDYEQSMNASGNRPHNFKDNLDYSNPTTQGHKSVSIWVESSTFHAIHGSDVNDTLCIRHSVGTILHIGVNALAANIDRVFVQNSTIDSFSACPLTGTADCMKL